MIGINIRRLQVFGVLAVLSLAHGKEAAWAAASEGARIDIKDFSYAPTTLTIKAGTTVTWTNLDDEPHTVVSDTGVFRSSALDTNDTFAFKFDKPGTYRLICSLHPRMQQTIIVEGTP